MRRAMHLDGVGFLHFQGLYIGWRVAYRLLMEWDIRAAPVSRGMIQTLGLLIFVLGVNICLYSAHAPPIPRYILPSYKFFYKRSKSFNFQISTFFFLPRLRNFRKLNKDNHYEAPATTEQRP